MYPRGVLYIEFYSCALAVCEMSKQSAQPIHLNICLWIIMCLVLFSGVVSVVLPLGFRQWRSSSRVQSAAVNQRRRDGLS